MIPPNSRLGNRLHRIFFRVRFGYVVVPNHKFFIGASGSFHKLGIMALFRFQIRSKPYLYTVKQTVRLPKYHERSRSLPKMIKNTKKKTRLYLSFWRQPSKILRQQKRRNISSRLVDSSAYPPFDTLWDLTLGHEQNEVEYGGHPLQAVTPRDISYWSMATAVAICNAVQKWFTNNQQNLTRWWKIKCER